MRRGPAPSHAGSPPGLRVIAAYFRKPPIGWLRLTGSGAAPFSDIGITPGIVVRSDGIGRLSTSSATPTRHRDLPENGQWLQGQSAAEAARPPGSADGAGLDQCPDALGDPGAGGGLGGLPGAAVLLDRASDAVVGGVAGLDGPASCPAWAGGVGVVLATGACVVWPGQPMMGKMPPREQTRVVALFRPLEKPLRMVARPATTPTAAMKVCGHVSSIWLRTRWPFQYRCRLASSICRFFRSAAVMVRRLGSFAIYRRLAALASSLSSRLSSTVIRSMALASRLEVRALSVVLD